MLLKTLQVKNFRQFVGEQSIEFSTTPNSNVTIIIGENGAGKTTLSQAFTWCLYGETSFEIQSLISRGIENSLSFGESAEVYVALELEHHGIQYFISRSQKYTKESGGCRVGQTLFKLTHKTADGQQELLSPSEAEARMKEILPKELSKYFFFNGERIEKMGKEIRHGKSKEFAEAVKNLLGLSAFTAALNHLKSRSKYSVIPSYANSYDASSDLRIAEYSKLINQFNQEISALSERLNEIDEAELLAQGKCDDLNQKIAKNEATTELHEQYLLLHDQLDALAASRKLSIKNMLSQFNARAQSYFSKKLILDVLKKLISEDKIDKGIPEIHERTIQYLIQRGKCLCGTTIGFNTEQHKQLMDLLAFIPPQSIGSAVSQFVRECDMISKNGENLFTDISTNFSIARNFENDFADVEDQIATLSSSLEGREDVGKLQQELTKNTFFMANLRQEKEDKIVEKSQLTTKKERLETELKGLALKDDVNRKIATYQAYAENIFYILTAEYAKREEETRDTLQSTINDIFKRIYAGKLSLTLDPKYNIQVTAEEDAGDIHYIEASTAQGISVIFAFIAGVIQMAKPKVDVEDEEIIVSEPYPLVMDAPFSSYDKARIQAVCGVLPQIAEQVIIFIKDTDGELAEGYLGAQVGRRYLFKRSGELETQLIER